MLIARAELSGVRGDVRLAGGRIAEIAPALARRAGEPVIDAGGGALLPGLHDHHLHLFALAAALRSVACGPPAVCDADSLGHALRAAARAAAVGAWLRGVDYHESFAGPLDRHRLDGFVPDHPVRIQHQSGDLWILNTPACHAVGLRDAMHAGIERDAAGEPTGRVYRADGWLRARLPASEAPSLAEVGRLLARSGVTAATDATPSNGADEIARFADAVAGGALPQRLVVMGRADLPEPARETSRVARGALKLRLAEFALPDFDSLVAEIAAAHARGRSVALHAVTRAELVFATAAFAAAGPRPGDRVEHAAVAPPECIASLATLGLTVVMQPGLVATRGDRFRRDVASGDAPYLYMCGSMLSAGVPVGGSTDAPYGDPDPWFAMRTAVDRRARDGTTLGAGEALSPEQALALFTSAVPGGPARPLEPGAPADLCLLDRPWRATRLRLEREAVVATWCEGRLAWSADPVLAAPATSSDLAKPAISSHAC